MDQHDEAQLQQPFGNPGMAIPPSPAAEAFENRGQMMAGAEPSDKTHDHMNKAARLGRSTLEAGTRAYHVTAERVQDLREKDMPPENAKKARLVASASAGTVAVAGTVGMAVRKWRHGKPVHAKSSGRLFTRAKEMMPSR